MSNFLIFFIITILSILFKLSSQNQNDIPLNISLENILEIIKNDELLNITLTRFTNYTVEEKKLIIKVKNGLFSNHHKYIDSLINIYNKNDTIKKYTSLLSNKTNGYQGIFKILHSFLHYHNEAMELFLNLTYDYPEIFDLLKLLGKNKIIDYYIYLLKDKGFLELIKKVGLIIIKNETILDNLFGIFEDNKLESIFDNKIQTKEDIYKIIKDIFDVCAKNKTIINTVKSMVNIYLKEEMKDLRFSQIFTNFLRLFFLLYSKDNENEIYSKLSPGCLVLLNYTLFGHLNDELKNRSANFDYDKEISQLYWYKFYFYSTKDKNDFLTFYNCLESKPIFEIYENIFHILDHHPVYTISMIDITETTALKRANTYFEDYHFTLGFCFPQGNESENNIIKNLDEKNSNDYYLCNNTDYEYLSKIIISYLLNIKNKDEIKVKAIEIRKENKKKDYLKYCAELIPLFILFIPIFIDIFLYFYKGCVIKMKKKTLMFKNINQIRDKENDNEEEEEDDNDKEVNNKKRKNIKFVKLVPRWYKILNEFFSLKNNAKDLFCFSTDVTNINNNNGLVYITGLIY